MTSGERPPNEGAAAAMEKGDARLAGGSLADVKAAIAQYEAAVHADPDHVRPHAKLGEAIRRSATFADDAKTARAILAGAEQALAVALGIDFRDTAARRSMGLVTAARIVVAADDTPETAALLAEGDARFSAGDFEGALAKYEAIATNASRHFTAIERAGRAHFALGRHAEAEACFRRAIVIEPNDAQAYLSLFEALSKQKKLKEMFTAAYGAVAAQPLHWPSWFRLADLLEQAKRPLTRMRLDPPGRIAKHPTKSALVLTIDEGTPSALARVWEAYVDELSSGIRQKKTAFKQERDALGAMIDEAKRALAKGAAFSPDVVALASLEGDEALAGATFILRFKDAMRIEYEAWKRDGAGASANAALRVELFIGKSKLRPI